MCPRSSASWSQDLALLRSWVGLPCRFRSRSRQIGFGALPLGLVISLWTESVTCTSCAGSGGSQGFACLRHRMRFQRNLKFEVYSLHYSESWAWQPLEIVVSPSFRSRRRFSCIDNYCCWKRIFAGLVGSCTKLHFVLYIGFNYRGNSLWFTSIASFSEDLLLHFSLKFVFYRNSERFWNADFLYESCWNFLTHGFCPFYLERGYCLQLEELYQVFQQRYQKRWPCFMQRLHWGAKNDFSEIHLWEYWDLLEVLIKRIPWL